LRVVLRGGAWWEVEFVHEVRGLTLFICDRDSIADERCHYYYRTFLPVFVHLMSRVAPSVRRAIGELSDGSHIPSDHLLFSANFDNALLVPDPEFFNSNAYQAQRESCSRQRPWEQRDGMMVWRGATTGSAQRRPGPLDILSPDTVQRVRFCATTSEIPDVDAKLYRVVSPLDPATDTEPLARAGLIGSMVPQDTWLDRRFAFDIDGNTNAWSNLFMRMLYGCCVIKVASPRSFRQWYYDRIEPWKHYVPVRADLGDLADRVAWCRSHPAECRDIAMAAQCLAQSMTVETETRYAVGRINQRLGQRLG
jgi:hypothetical protein